MLSVCAEAIVPSSVGYVEWDVTNHVKDAIREGLSNVDFLIKAENEDLGTFADSIGFRQREETTNYPLLNIDGTDIHCTKDNCIKENSPTSNYAPSQLVVDLRTNKTSRPIISFPINSITNFDTATLKLYMFTTVGIGKKIQVYKLTRSDWVETESTWNIYKTGSNWTTAGGDYIAEVEDLPVASSAPPQRIWPAEYPRLYP